MAADTAEDFSALNVDGSLLAKEMLMMMQSYPNHFDDVDFIVEQLFTKKPLEGGSSIVQRLQRGCELTFRLIAKYNGQNHRG